MNRFGWIALALSLGVMVGCKPPSTATVNTTAVKAFVKVEPAIVGKVERVLELSAVVEAGQSLDLLPDVPGKIRELPVKLGAEVKTGDVLARLDTDMARYQLQQAEAALKLATLGIETAEKASSRAEALHGMKSLTDQQFEQAKAGLEMARLQKEQASAMKGLAQKQLQGGILVAPFDGVISSVCCEVGAYFNPMTVSPMGGPQNLVGLVNIDTLKLELNLSERDIGKVTLGMPAHVLVDSVKDLLPQEGLTGKVDAVGAAADAASGTFPVRVLVDNAQHIVRAGTHARVRLVLEAKDAVLVVKSAAVQTEKDQRYVLTVKEGKAHRVLVTVGLETPETTEIESGLSEGDQVVVEGNFGLPEGGAVEVSP